MMSLGACGSEWISLCFLPATLPPQEPDLDLQGSYLSLFYSEESGDKCNSMMLQLAWEEAYGHMGG
jgi:hypothetical protein